MLTRLRFKNWRSLRDVEIDDLQPINVFIGANSSGKTNILDGLRFLRDVSIRGMVQTIYRWGGREKLQTIGVEEQEIELEFSFYPSSNSEMQLTQLKRIQFQGKGFEVAARSVLYKNSDAIIYESQADNYPPTTAFWEGAETRKWALAQYVLGYTSKRWQILAENFSTHLTLPAGSDLYDLYLLEPDTKNLPFILDFMRKTQPNLYTNLKADLQWLLGYIEEIETERDERETKLILREKAHGGLEAPSISSGTGRIIAMLTAFYALEMDVREAKGPFGAVFDDLARHYNEMPGLVVIEEPDTALNPHLFKRFVEQLRNYVEGEYPRQVILTTHNPQLLDYFQPEEVRIVERDEQGYTSVNRVPEHIKDIWLDKYTLGEVWMTRSLGGVPE